MGEMRKSMKAETTSSPRPSAELTPVTWRAVADSVICSVLGRYCAMEINSVVAQSVDQILCNTVPQSTSQRTTNKQTA